MKGLVIVRFDENGEQTFHVAGKEVRLFIVDERVPGDRVYEWLPRDDADTIKGILGDDPIGNSADDRHEAIKHRLLRALECRKHLESVE